MGGSGFRETRHPFGAQNYNGEKENAIIKDLLTLFSGIVELRKHILYGVIYKAYNQSYDRAKTHMIGENCFLDHLNRTEVLLNFLNH